MTAIKIFETQGLRITEQISHPAVSKSIPPTLPTMFLRVVSHVATLT
ncbi:hypothetical protein NOVOSPHI9U_290034 [Novosphingobium sp. 9U]|nr:hypothetical protein NOVOSPHI9U_290034 [Novosphingobium sp. 9U]